MNKATVREYQPGDSKKIYTLFAEYSPYKRDAAFWVWLNRMLSDKKAIIVVAIKDNALIGHYAVIPQTVKINHKLYDSGLAIHAFIHPDHRNGFLIFQITKKMYKVTKEAGIDFLYGFPNENFRDIQVKADKWKQVSLFNSLEKESLSLKDTDLSLRSIEDNYQDIYALSEILDRKSENNHVQIQKNLNYYLNRYIRHPQELYQNFFIIQSNSTVGFICLKVYDNSGDKIGHLIDYISIENIHFKDILQTVENYFYNKVSKLSVWKFSEDSKRILVKNNFIENGFQTFLGVKMLCDNKKLEDNLVDFSNWNLCMGDSDAF